ncbi:nucleolar protein 58-like [Linepithema humile]|uniref:nucleolar protein 58-like n=1 Tax=Linepithema humile TaxID=83485 RepID=UPI0006230446|nr:PREDICTED: probable ATP-dependent RNA helicase DDX46 [Linepithema humile]
MTWNPNYQPYRSWREQIAKEAESKNKVKRKNCNKFQIHQSNTDNRIKYGDDKKSEESDRTDNSSLKSPRKTYDCKEKKDRRIQRLTIQTLRKASLDDILLKRIQPSLSDREWIINQRHVSREKPKIYTAKDVSKPENKPFEFEKTEVYYDKRKWRNKKRDNSENRIKRSMKANGFDKNKDKQKMRRKREDIPENKRKLIKKSKHWQIYKEEDKDGSVCSFDSEIYLTGLTLIE